MMKKKIWKRNILFWGKCGVGLTIILLGFSIFYGVLFSIGEEKQNFWETCYFYAALLGIVLGITGPLSYGVSYLSIALSFGSGRKEAVFGSQIRSVVFLLSEYLFLTILGYMRTGKSTAALDVMFLEITMFAIAAGQLSSVASMRYGIKGIVVSVLLFVVTLIAVTVSGMQNWDKLFDMGNFLFFGNAGIFLKVAGIFSIVFYGMSVVFLMKGIKKFEIKG